MKNRRVILYYIKLPARFLLDTKKRQPIMRSRQSSLSQEPPGYEVNFT